MMFGAVCKLQTQVWTTCKTTKVRRNLFLVSASNVCFEAEPEQGKFIRPTQHLSETNFGTIGGAIHIVGEQDRAAASLQQLAGSDGDNA